MSKEVRLIIHGPNNQWMFFVDEEPALAARNAFLRGNPFTVKSTGQVPSHVSFNPAMIVGLEIAVDDR